MLLKRGTHAPELVRTRRRMDSRIVMASLSAVLALTVVSTLGVAANASPNSAHVATTPTAKAASAPKGWRLAFTSNFSGTKINTKVWGECYPWANPSVGCTHFGNNLDPEKEWYQESQVQVSNGVLDLVAQPDATMGENAQGQPEEYYCRSGMVTTYPSLSFKYAAIQITARIPFGLGLWSAFWLAAKNEQWPPEVDILEHWSSQLYSRAFLHVTGFPELAGLMNLPNADTGWHTFSLSWTKTRLTWWFDGKQVMTTTKGVPQQAMYLILNLAVDNDNAGGCDGTLEIKSVKVWLPINSNG